MSEHPITNLIKWDNFESREYTILFSLLQHFLAKYSRVMAQQLAQLFQEVDKFMFDSKAELD